MLILLRRSVFLSYRSIIPQMCTQPMAEPVNITHHSVSVTLHSSALHQEEISFLITTMPKQPFILGNTWLCQHNLITSWTTGEITKWSWFCKDNCPVQPMLHVLSMIVESPATLTKVKIPHVYLSYHNVFSKSKATGLPPHRDYDCHIELHSNAQPPRSKVSPLLQ